MFYTEQIVCFIIHSCSCLRWQVSLFVWQTNQKTSTDNEEKSLIKQSHDNILKAEGCLGSFSHLMINKNGLASSSETKI